jgi:hypothetical protein
MTLSNSQSVGQGLISAHQLMLLRSFALWVFTLTVCMLVIGFPVLAVVVTIGTLMAIMLQAVLPTSAVLLVAGVILGVHLLGVVVAAGALTLQGFHPQEMSWLRWLNGDENPNNTTVYAACPLTCEINHS